MKKVIIVDDEYIILQGMLHMLDWNKFGYQVVFHTQDACKALNYVKSNPVDIIISDIVMPEYDGLDFLAEVKFLKDNIFVLFVTSHRDFSFAQEAIRLGASDYILKSDLAPDTLLSSLNALPIKVDLSEKHDLQLPLKTELDSYINNHTPVTDHIKNFLKAQSYGLIFIEKKYEEKLDEIIDDLFYIKTVDHNQNYIILIDYLLMPQLISNLDNCFYTPAFDKLDKIHNYVQAFKKQKEIKFYSNKNTITKINLNFLWEPMSNFCHQKYQNFLDEEKYYHALDYFYQYIQHEMDLKDSFPLDLKSFISNTIYQFLTNLEAQKIIENESTNLKLDFVNRIQTSKSCEELLAQINDIMAELSILIQKSVNDNRNSLKIAIEHFLQENYYKNIGLADLADNFSFSYNYMSELFKSNFNISFNDVLNQIRINHAKVLLIKSKTSLKEISTMVGYNNYSHFSNTFSKLTNLSPSDYRRINNDK